MIKNIRVEIEGFVYNIVQMSGEQAFRLQLRLLNLASNCNLEGISNKDADNVGNLMLIIKAILSAANPDVIMPLVKELLSTCALLEVNTALASSEGYNPERHFNKKVSLDNFFGKDLVHLYQLLFEVLKANYADFFEGAKKWFGSNLLSGNSISNPQFKPA